MGDGGGTGKLAPRRPKAGSAAATAISETWGTGVLRERERTSTNNESYSRSCKVLIIFTWKRRQHFSTDVGGRTKMAIHKSVIAAPLSVGVDVGGKARTLVRQCCMFFLVYCLEALPFSNSCLFRASFEPPFIPHQLLTFLSTVL